MRQFSPFAIWFALAGCALAEVDFSREVLPILSDTCFQCHGPDAKQRKADLRLDDEANAKLERDGGLFAIKPGSSAESEILRRLLTADPDEKMPPPKLDRALKDEQIATIKQWIDEGAKWGRHWAFNRVPEMKDADFGTRNPVDYFIEKKLVAAGITPNPPAPPETLIRRLSLDLTGLPPTPSELNSFLDSASRNPDSAFRSLVQQLLAKPAYGERMAWDWLDAARYADSNGYQGDSERTMWPWRDWVIDAFNLNTGWDEFTIQQLAGDLLPDAKPEQILATGFCRNHMINGEGGRIAAENRVDYVMDMAETAGTVWLGLTVGCARCHDHKFDPISQADYYSLFAFFNQTPVDGGGGNAQTPPVLARPTPEQTARETELAGQAAELQKLVSASEAELAKSRPAWEQGRLKAADADPALVAALKIAPDKRAKEQNELILKTHRESDPEHVKLAAELDKARKDLDGHRKSIPKVMVMAEIDKPRQTFILGRGLYNLPTETEVHASAPAVFQASLGENANRLALARWLVSRDNPLTARVTVNRFWQQIFGVGLVKTSNDFGAQGEFPSHPELLDWLAADFMDSGWDVKHLLTTIVTSDAYRRSSTIDSPAAFERDPENRLLARGPRFRMPSWMIRDQALAASGLLVETLGGKPVNGYQPAGIWEEATFGNKKYVMDSGDALHRRSVYTFWRRIVGPTMFFDAGKRQVCEVKSTRTNTPMHALTTLNDVTFVEAARALAERAFNSAAADDDTRIRQAIRFVLARAGTDAEVAVWKRSLERARAEILAQPIEAEALLAIGESKRDRSIPPVEHAALTSVCLGLLNLDEALTKE